MTLQETYERNDAGRELKVQKARIEAHIQQIKISLTAIRAVKEKYVEAGEEVDGVVNALKTLVSGIV